MGGTQAEVLEMPAPVWWQVVHAWCDGSHWKSLPVQAGTQEGREGKGQPLGPPPGQGDLCGDAGIDKL